MIAATFVRQYEAAEVVDRLRQADPVVVEALLDPDNFTRRGALDHRKVARATGRTGRELESSLNRLRAVASR